MEIQCQKCSKLIPADADGRLPPWCPQCGSGLDTGTASPHWDAPRKFARTPASRGKNLALLFAAMVCGLLVCFYFFDLNARPQPKRIERDHYTVETTHWEVDEDRQRVLGTDLVLRFRFRGGDAAYFTVQVIQPQAGSPVLADLVAQLKRFWQNEPGGWKLQEEGPASLAGVEGQRLVAVSQVGSEPRQREGIVLIYQGIGYYVICEALKLRLDAKSTLSNDFRKLKESFTFRENVDPAPSKPKEP